MNRRSLFKGLFGAAGAAVIPKAVPSEVTVSVGVEEDDLERLKEKWVLCTAMPHTVFDRIYGKR